MAMLPSVSVVVGDAKKPPECAHGPTILFRRTANGEERLFYACSACRDRKGCRFFLYADQELDDSKKKLWEKEAERVLPKIDHQKLYVKLMKLLQSSHGRVYCHDCSELYSSNDAKKHQEHNVTANLTDYQMTHPSELLKPIENSKKEAQYLFSKKGTETMVAALKLLGFKNILCIGTPRLHEYIQSQCLGAMDSLLLDIDHRYHQFFGPLQFCWYNVFNNYYFNKSTGAQIVSDFLLRGSGTGIAIVMDPPFGGRVEPLAHTVQQINEKYKALNNGVIADLKVLWTFPYFMEQHILKSLPDYKMLDFKVNYDNHPLFTKGSSGRKYGSPVRIFTNISPKDFPLPEDEGYRFCKPCQRWVSQENKHCKKCSSCPSKDGQTYVHCSICKKCVKPNWAHCEVCKRCYLKDHNCDEAMKSSACFNCGKIGHKKADCPKKAGKRKLDIDRKNGANKKQKFENVQKSKNKLEQKKSNNTESAMQKKKGKKQDKKENIEVADTLLHMEDSNPNNIKLAKKKRRKKKSLSEEQTKQIITKDFKSKWSPKKSKIEKKPQKVRNKMKKKLRFKTCDIPLG